VFDQAGVAHTVSFQFERQDDGTWNVVASIPPSEGTVVSGTITGLDFNDDGTLASTPATSSISIQFTGQGAPQTLAMDFGTPGDIDGLSQLGGGASAYASGQDGYGVGTLSNMAVSSNGDIEGFYSNGQTQVLGSLGIATFTNDAGLREVGNNLWAETVNSGTRTVGQGQQGPAGEVIGGSLENSNVQIAAEFVSLIEAQRGFQANARVISTTNEVLRDLVNLL
jgi:flagellar hook protein FlgE